MVKREKASINIRKPKKIWKKVLIIVGIVIAVPIVLIIALFVYAAFRPAAPNNYETAVETGGVLEAKYLAHGEHKVAYREEKTEEFFEKYEFFYPEELENSEKKYPVIVMANGSGIVGSKYKAVFRHYASWGFVVIGNEDQSSWEGVSSEKCLKYLMEENENPQSPFFGKIDLENVGIVGHSQGGVAVFNAVSAQEHASLYKAAAALSPTNEVLAGQLGWPYDLTKVEIPVLILAGTVGEFETQAVIPYESMVQMYEKISSPKAMGRKKGCEHGQMLYSADGYVTAWFLWQLQGDQDAAKAFVGDDAEILKNPLYQNQQTALQ